MLSDRAWGGGIELFAFSHSRRVNLHVYRVSICMFLHFNIAVFDYSVRSCRCA